MAVIFTLATLSLIGCDDDSPPDLAELVPGRLSQMDPNVASLVERQAGKIKADPGNAVAYAELGMIYEANLMWAAARRAYEAAVELDQASTWWRFHLAISTREAGDLERALELLEEMVVSDPNLAPIQHRLGAARVEAGDLNGASNAYRSLIELEPDRPEGYHGLGEVMLLERNFQAASELLERSLAINPRYRAARYPLGLAYRGLGRLQDAKREMAYGADTWLQYLPDPLTPKIREYTVNLPAQRNMAAVMLQRNRPDQAAELLENILQKQPRNATDLNNLAIAYMRQGRFQDAKAKLDTAREIAPEKFSTWLNLSSLAARTGDREAALIYARGAVERAPNVATVHVSLARAEAEMGRIDLAADSLERAVQLDPQDAQARGMLAEINVRRGRFEAAEENFLGVLTLIPDSLTAVLGLGRLYLQQGRAEKARLMLARAQKLAGGQASVAAFENEIAISDRGDTQ